MSDALPLPARPNLEQYRKLAKDLQHACKSAAADTIREWASRWASSLRHEDAARLIEYHWNRFQERSPGDCTLARAQFFVARSHGFKSWPAFSKHLRELANVNSPVSQFEAAADAIVSGDLATLATLLRDNSGLVRERSTRADRSTLLHYVSANGVEDFRQKTPKNIVEITRLLLEAGADVNAESDAYGGRSTTLGLAATSWHPQHAGVQIPLMELLIDHGAIIDGPDSGSAVNGCLANGRKEAAGFLAGRGARLDLEGAAGVGRLDVVQSYFHDDGSLKPPATEQQMKDGFAWACEFGRTDVVEFLLQRGMEVGTKLRHHGQTGLHWAGLGGNAGTVRLLLQRGASVEAVDDRFGGTALDWTLHGWNESENGQPYYEVVALLIRAGAQLKTEEYDEKIHADPRMQAALRGDSPPW